MSKTKRTSLRDRPVSALASGYGKPDDENPQKAETKKSRNPETKQTGLVKVNWQMTEERLHQVKRYAVDHKKKLYEVMDEALGDYLEPKAS